MTVKELKTLLNDFDENLEVAFGDYDDDSDGETVFDKIDGAEQLTDDKKQEFVALHN